MLFRWKIPTFHTVQSFSCSRALGLFVQTFPSFAEPQASQPRLTFPLSWIRGETELHLPQAHSLRFASLGVVAEIFLKESLWVINILSCAEEDRVSFFIHRFLYRFTVFLSQIYCSKFLRFLPFPDVHLYHSTLIRKRLHSVKTDSSY